MSAQARMDDAQAAFPPARVLPAEPAADRTPLSVVPTPLPRSGSGVAVLSAVVLIVALVLVLVMNITMSNRQYGLIDLRAEQKDVTETNERLAEQVGYLDAPQNLAARAEALGMVTAGGSSAVDVADGSFSESEGAAAGAGVSATYVAPPADADQARQGVAASEDARAELPGPTTVDPEEAAAEKDAAKDDEARDADAPAEDATADGTVGP